MIGLQRSEKVFFGSTETPTEKDAKFQAYLVTQNY